MKRTGLGVAYLRAGVSYVSDEQTFLRGMMNVKDIFFEFFKFLGLRYLMVEKLGVQG